MRLVIEIDVFRSLWSFCRVSVSSGFPYFSFATYIITRGIQRVCRNIRTPDVPRSPLTLRTLISRPCCKEILYRKTRRSLSLRSSFSRWKDKMLDVKEWITFSCVYVLFFFHSVVPITFTIIVIVIMLTFVTLMDHNCSHTFPGRESRKRPLSYLIFRRKKSR